MQFNQYGSFVRTFLNASWWKYLGVALIIYSLIAGLLIKIPALPIIYESIRNLFYHVPMWFAMILILLLSVIFSIRYLQTNNPLYDVIAAQTASVGLLFGCLGMVTGMLWAAYTWGEPWSNDPQQMSSAIALLIYFAYFVLRGSMEDEDKRGKVSAVYNIFAFCAFIPLIFVVPRLTDSLHPGKGGNPAFNTLDLDSTMRMVFYPAIIGWIFVGMWIASLKTRLELIRLKKLDMM